MIDGRIKKDPTIHLTSPKAWFSLPKYLTVKEVQALLRQPDAADVLGIRDKAMLEVMYAAGLRVSELVGLKKDDVHLKDDFVLCRGKGGKERIVPLGKAAVEAVQNYLDEARPKLVRAPGEALFLTRRGGPFTRQGFWKMLRPLRPRRPSLGQDQPPRPPPFIRDSSAGGGGGSAFRPAHARTQPDHDDPDLHSRQPRTPAAGVRQVPSPRLNCGRRIQFGVMTTLTLASWLLAWKTTWSCFWTQLWNFHVQPKSLSAGPAKILFSSRTTLFEPVFTKRL